MRAAFPHWENRIAPLFDTARPIRVIDVEEMRVIAQAEEILKEDLPQLKAGELVRLGVSVLVCGAISRELQAMVSAQGIVVVPFVAGDLEKVMQAFLKGEVRRKTYAMPGCHGRNRQRGMAHCFGSRETGGKDAGRGPGVGASGSQGGLRPCARCGYRVLAEKSSSCAGNRCPRCGTALAGD